jgi:hypothetical protein
LIEPLARISKRFAALFFVFIFGIVGRPFLGCRQALLAETSGPAFTCSTADVVGGSRCHGR